MIVLLVAFAAAVLALPSQPESSAPSKQPASPATAPAPEPDAFQRRLDEVDQRVGQLKGLRADFEQRKTSSLLKEPLVSRGTVTVKGDRVRWDTTSPRKTTMTIGAGEARLYDPDAKVVEIYRLAGDLRELTGSPLPRLATLRPRFDIARMEPAVLGITGDTLIGIELTPKTAELKKHINTVRVVIDTTIPCLKKMEVTDTDGDRTVLELRSTRIDDAVADSDVTLAVPDGTRESRPLDPGPRKDVSPPQDDNRGGKGPRK